jgi:hypothetical protein
MVASLTPSAAPFLAAAVMLGLAGAAKLVRPEDTARALHAAGLPFGRRSVRAGAAAEVAVAVVAVAVPDPWTGALVALAYASFTGFVVIALRKGWALASCGCFAKPDSRPTYAHAAVNFASVLAAAWWSLSKPDRLGSSLARSPWHGAAVGVVTAVIAILAYLVWTTPAEMAR